MKGRQIGDGEMRKSMASGDGLAQAGPGFLKPFQRGGRNSPRGGGPGRAVGGPKPSPASKTGITKASRSAKAKGVYSREKK